MGKVQGLRGLARLKPAALGLGLAAGLAACSPTFVNHGHIPPPEDLSAIEIGADRAAVVAAIGAPGAAGVVREEAWFYTAYRVRNFAYRAPEIIEREIVAISFDADGLVTNIERFGLEDGGVVRLSRRVTTGSIQDLGLLRQIFGNFGRVDLGQIANDS